MKTVAYSPTFKQRLRDRLRSTGGLLGYNWRALCERAMWIGHKPGNLEKHALRELKLAGAFDQDGFYAGMLGTSVLRMVRLFADDGHSGMSASLALAMFKKVAAFEPLTPITGEPSEWNEVGDGIYQNNRCSHVFSNETGPYDLNGRVFRYPNGSCYTSRESRTPVTFPYTPAIEYVDVPEPEGFPA